MRGCNNKTLLMQLALTQVIAATVFHTVVRNFAVHNPSHSVDGITICECRTSCLIRPDCSGASYDYESSVCNTTDAHPDNTSLQLQPSTVALLKFDPFYRSHSTPSVPTTCPTDPPNGTVYVTELTTKDPSVENQQMMCEKERGGVPFVIETEQQRKAGADAISNAGADRAWLTLKAKYDRLQYKPLFWPDGSPLSYCAFPKEFRQYNFQMFKVLLNTGEIEDGFFGCILFVCAQGAPVLCLKPPTNETN